MADIFLTIASYIELIPPLWLWLVFGVEIVVVIIFSLILHYHWRLLGAKKITGTKIAYFVGLVLLLLLSLLALITFQLVNQNVYYS